MHGLAIQQQSFTNYPSKLSLVLQYMQQEVTKHHNIDYTKQPHQTGVNYHNVSLLRQLLNHQNINGDTCLHLAVKHLMVDNVKSLCEFSKSTYGSLLNINCVNQMKNTPCHCAAINNTITVMKVLVKYGCDVLRRNGLGLSSFELAENFGYGDMCVYLDPIVEEATIWSQKNCLAKLFVCRKKI